MYPLWIMHICIYHIYFHQHMHRQNKDYHSIHSYGHSWSTSNLRMQGMQLARCRGCRGSLILRHSHMYSSWYRPMHTAYSVLHLESSTIRNTYNTICNWQKCNVSVSASFGSIVSASFGSISSISYRDVVEKRGWNDIIFNTRKTSLKDVLRTISHTSQHFWKDDSLFPYGGIC